MKLLMAGCLLLFSVTGIIPLQVKGDYNPKTADTSKYAILQFDEKRDHYHFDTGVNEVTLSAEDLDKVDSLFKIAVKKHAKLSKLNPQSPSRYYKQVIAVTNARGEKVIWINCLCTNDFPYWRTRPVLVLDGGSCFFNLNINLNTGEDYNFSVNGVA